MRPALLFCIILFTALTSWARTITVDDDGFADFNNIQAAINDAANDDLIIVANGTHPWHCIINKGLESSADAFVR